MSKIKLNAPTGGGSVSLEAPSSTQSNSNIEFKLPTQDGSSGQVLKTDGSGNLSFGADTGGKILKVTQNTFTGTGSFGINNGATYIPNAPTGQITPSSSSNQVLVNIQMTLGINNNGETVHLILYRDINQTGTFSAVTDAIGAAAGNRRRITTAYRSSSSYGMYNVNIKFLDTPNTDNVVQYRVGVALLTTGYIENFINRAGVDTDASTYGRAYSTIILSEVAP